MLNAARIVALTAGLALSSGAVEAQTWPSRQVFIIIPFPAGGGTDAAGQHHGAEGLDLARVQGTHGYL